MKKLTQKAIDELKYIDKSNGLTPQSVVKSAKAKGSHLKSYFEWNDGRAAKKWREEQARELIDGYRVIVETADVTYSVPVYVRDTRCKGNEAGYASIRDIKRSKVRKVSTVIYELERAAAILHRAAGIAAALDVECDIQGLADQANAMCDRLRG